MSQTQKEPGQILRISVLSHKAVSHKDNALQQDCGASPVTLKAGNVQNHQPEGVLRLGKGTRPGANNAERKVRELLPGHPVCLGTKSCPGVPFQEAALSGRGPERE